MYYIVFRRIFISISNLYLNIYYLWCFSLILEKNAWVYVAGSSKNMPGWSDIRSLNECCNLPKQSEGNENFISFLRSSEKSDCECFIWFSRRRCSWRVCGENGECWKISNRNLVLGVRELSFSMKLITRNPKGTKNLIICMCQLATIPV